jgi:phosphoesterase RecJ-like protein
MEKRRDPEAVARAIQAAGTVAMCAHVSPDGDTIGSTLALKLGLEQLGKRVTVFCQDKVPDNLRFLPGASGFLTPDEALGKHYDLLLAVDVSDERRLGSCIRLKDQCAHTAQIDHHGTNPCSMEQNDIDANASATALLARELLRVLGVKLTREIGMCLYTGISTDTGNFSFGNTTAEAFDVMSELMALQLPLSDMNRMLFRERSRAQLELISRALQSLRFYQHDQIAAMYLTLDDFAKCGALPEHADTIVNFGIDVAGVKMALLARETEMSGVKMSLRALAPCTVDDIAASFGGGGHAQAAGCTIEGTTVEAAVAQVVDAMSRALNGESE